MNPMEPSSSARGPAPLPRSPFADLATEAPLSSSLSGLAGLLQRQLLGADYTG